MSKHNGNAGSVHGNEVTYVFKEMLTPSLVLPWQLCSTLQSNKEFPLKIQQFVKVGKQKVDCILVNQVTLRQGVGIFLGGY